MRSSEGKNRTRNGGITKRGPAHHGQKNIRWEIERKEEHKGNEAGKGVRKTEKKQKGKDNESQGLSYLCIFHLLVYGSLMYVVQQIEIAYVHAY